MKLNDKAKGEEMSHHPKTGALTFRSNFSATGLMMSLYLVLQWGSKASLQNVLKHIKTK
jgi:hypothetical protein